MSQRSKALWEPLIQRFHNKLNTRAAKNLNTDEKLTLMQSTLDSLLVYCFNFFHKFARIRNQLDKIRRNFLWGAGKINLTSWNKVLLGKNFGGLNITNLEHRKLAMLGKFQWRIKQNKQSSWIRLLKNKYGVDSNKWLIDQSIRVTSTLINNLRYLYIHIHSKILFNKDIYKWIACKGNRILFWEDCWAGEYPLHTIYPRLYKIIKHKHTYIKDMLMIWKRNKNTPGLLWNNELRVQDCADTDIIYNIIYSLIIL